MALRFAFHVTVHVTSYANASARSQRSARRWREPQKVYIPSFEVAAPFAQTILLEGQGMSCTVQPRSRNYYLLYVTPGCFVVSKVIVPVAGTLQGGKARRLGFEHVLRGRGLTSDQAFKLCVFVEMLEVRGLLQQIQHGTSGQRLGAVQKLLSLETDEYSGDQASS